MKKFLLAGVCLAWTAALAAPAWSQAPDSDPQPVFRNAAFMKEVGALARGGLRVSAGPDPDTVYVGFSATDHWNAATNYWNLWTGTRRPGVNDPANAIWDWDHTGILAAHGVGDSLCGWWPDLALYTTTGGFTFTDDLRSWWAQEMGNTANYVMNQGLGGKRTYGVVGVWHGDGGANQPGGSGVSWAPLSGNRSAWCGLRQLNDHSVLDAVTGNPYNQSVLERTAGGTTFGGRRRYPGYANQWDQMLYRDLAAPAGQPLSLSFLYRTRLSWYLNTAASTRVGWFHGDPLAVVAGNFISSSAAGQLAPIDSFMVYVGAPVDDAHCTYSDGSVGAVYDPQRRWFSEVLRLFDGAPYYEVMSRSAYWPIDTADATPAFSATLPARMVDAIRNAAGNTNHLVRLVFRVKTNRGGSDDDDLGIFDSCRQGAVLLDDVTVNGSVIGDFEGAEQSGQNSIDNRIGVSPLNNWKSTGKPPSVYAHLGNLEAGINYAELCGAWDSPARFCDIRGNVLMMGNYDVFEAMLDPRYTVYREGFPGAWSPTINTTVPRDGSNAANPIGLTESIVDATDGFHLLFDVYAGMLNLPFSGVGYWPKWMVYPVTQANNGATVWSDPLSGSFLVYNPDPQCYGDWYNLDLDIGRPTLANAYNQPDSIRVWLGIYQACFRFGVTLGCNGNGGVYFDNVSGAFVDNPALQASGASAINTGALSAAIWEFPADVFPANETPLLSLANFDTTTALIKGPRNMAQNTGDQLRFDIQPDTVLVSAGDVSGSTDPLLGNTTRLDLVFRILPGPGNYASAGARTFPPTPGMALLDLPTNQANTVSPGDGSFWGEYIARPGVFAGGDHNGHTRWDYLTWNSARCDTAEANVFPVAGRIGTGLVAGVYANMLHEEDPHFATLGTTRFRCFMVDTAGTAANTNIVCNGTIPAWLTTVPPSRTGWDGSATTKEFTKVIPDGLLTAGAHVQYFYRKSARADSLNAYVLMPDTNSVYQAGEGPSTDGHRWQQFGVLPDRWKDPAFGGSGMACMLYVDWNDRRGNERVFVSLQDSLCGTEPWKYGAHNGWHAPRLRNPTFDDLAAYPVYGKNQQPGTTWDMYGVRAAESGATGGVSLGARLANRASMGYAANRYARTAPTPEMLRRFYRMITLLTGDLNSGLTGPFFNKSQDDIAILNDFLTGSAANSTDQPRGLFIGGDGFVQDEDLLNGQNASHGLFISTKLGLTLRNGSYPAVSNNTNDCADLLTTPGIITWNDDIYGVGNSCAFSNDLFQRNPAVAEAVDATYYENVGINGPYVASVYKPANAGASRNWVAHTEGWNIANLLSRYCDTATGRMSYYWNMYNALFAAQCQITNPHCVTDVPQGPGGAAFVNFMKVGNSVVRSGSARVRFGLASPDRIRVRLYDVAGRLVRTLADRSFGPGEYDLPWDGADDAGRASPRGVYFARLEYVASGRSINGRIVLLK